MCHIKTAEIKVQFNDWKETLVRSPPSLGGQEAKSEAQREAWKM